MVVKRKILVVEDNMLNRSLLCEILNKDYETVEAENGREALECLKKSGGEISLIMLDIVMPVMDGYEFLDAVKGNAAYASIPVIVTTQKDSESDEIIALSHGAVDFVAKPYNSQIILHRVASIIHLQETAAIVNEFQYDRLTGLYSKRFFYKQVKDIIQHNPDKKYDIICSDIVNFKLINDVFGVPTGDRLLCGIADLYVEFIGKKGICSRFNADQFVCLSEHDDEYSDKMFQDLCAKSNAMSQAKNIVIKWGIYYIEDRDISVEQMCDRAILAARSIKEHYGKYFAVYDDALRSKLLQEQAVSDSMEAALEDDQFEIYMQPKYRIRDNCLVGSEALVRWNHPQWGMQLPWQFIPMFEKNGFITKLDQYVWDKVCAVLRDWDNRGLPPMSISVNVSRADIYNANLADILMELVRKYNLHPSRLHLEITESAYTENPRQIIDTVSQLRELGFVIEMDDFGKGYSSLSMLDEMPVDILKLDMNFIQRETAKPINQGILRFIISLAQWMSLGVVAEGVETEEQLERLREIGCDCVQGYYFAKPMPVKEFEKLVNKQFLDKNLREEEISLEFGSDQVLLIADEDSDYRNEVKKTFGQYYKVVEALDGKMALTAIAANADKLVAVVLSLTLDNPDGFDVLKMLQKEKELRYFPVIVTAKLDAQAEWEALDIGADDFICKPHLQQTLWECVRRAGYNDWNN